MNELVEAHYRFHRHSPDHGRHLAHSLRALAAAEGPLAGDGVGQCAAVLNLAFDLGAEVPPGLAKAYVQGFHRFVRERRVVDEQQWRAFFRVAEAGLAPVDPDLFPLLRDVLVYGPGGPPPFWARPETQVQALALKVLLGADTVCLPTAAPPRR